jgi:TPR repeat protein
MYAEGVEQDYSKAREYWEKAAKQGYKSAIEELEQIRAEEKNGAKVSGGGKRTIHKRNKTRLGTRKKNKNKNKKKNKNKNFSRRNSRGRKKRNKRRTRKTKY